MTYDEAQQEARRIACDAYNKYGPYSSPHEVLGVLEEEFMELKADLHKSDWRAARLESLDIAAVCLRFASEPTIREDNREI